MTNDGLLLYGATGYTGRLLARAALARGLRPVLAGRRAAELHALAAELGLEARVAALDDAAALARAFAGIRVLLNAAGPFIATAPALSQACLRHRVHYLDVTGEVQVMDQLQQLSARARDAGIMLLPGAGFDVVATDCLALHVLSRAQRPRHLHLGIAGLVEISRGSARTLIGTLTEPVWTRRDGSIVRIPPASLQRAFDYGQGPRPSLAVSNGDVVASYFSSGVPNISTYFEATSAVIAHNTLVRWLGPLVPFTPWQTFLDLAANWMPPGPSPAQREQRSATIVAEVEQHDGGVVRARLYTPEAYSLTALTASAIAERALRGDVQPGYETPARLYGADFVLGFPGVVRQDF